LHCFGFCLRKQDRQSGGGASGCDESAAIEVFGFGHAILLHGCRRGLDSQRMRAEYPGY
jgi:hypothetical protein